MKTWTTNEWKKVVPKSRRKASPICKKTGTISYNPKQNGSKTENYGKTRKYINKKVPGTICSQGPKSPKLDKRYKRYSPNPKNVNRNRIRQYKVLKNTWIIGPKKSQGSNNRNTSKSSTAPQNQHPNVTTWKE